MADEEVKFTKEAIAKELLRRRQLRAECQGDLLSFIQHTHPDWENAPHHRLLCDWLMRLEAQEITNLAVFAPPRHGKACSHATKCLTTEGWKSHGNLRVGDSVFSADGTPTKVVAIGPEVSVDYKVQFYNGTSVVCHGDHEWVVYDRNVRQYRTLETRDLENYLYSKSYKESKDRANFLINPPEPLQMPKKELKIHPYVLGAWLGDGNSAVAYFHGAKGDIEYIADRFASLGLKNTSISEHKLTGVLTVGYQRDTLDINQYNLRHNKHIPPEYLLASEEQRRELLRGLVDTDGCSGYNGRIRFVNCNKQLIDSVTELVRSLGYRASVSSQAPIMSSSGICGKQIVYTVQWTPHDGERQAWLPRKDIRRIRTRARLGIKAVIRVPSEKGRCIQIAHPSGLYLVGKTLIPTHNSEIVSRRFPAWCMGRHPNWEMICAQANGELARDMGGNVRDIIASPEYKEIFPDIALKTDSKAAGRWIIDNPNGPNGVYFAAGVGGTIIGRGANLLNIDDPLDAEGAHSPRKRDIAGNFYFGDAVQRLMTPGLQLFTTTRRHEDDLAGRILPPPSEWVPTKDPKILRAEAKKELNAAPEIWWIINLPAISNEGTDKEEALWPGIKKPRFPLPALKSIRSRLIRQGHSREWYAQYQQQITPEEGNYCKRAWYADRYDTPPEGLAIYATSDMAVTQERVGADPDYTEHCIYGLEGLVLEYTETGKLVATADNIYVLDWWKGRTTPDKWIESLIDLLKKWEPVCWFGTKGTIRNAIEGYLIRELNKHRVYTRIEWLGDLKTKSAKGSTLQGLSSAGRVKFPSTIWADQVIENICTFPNALHDDAFDTAANMARSLGEIPTAFYGAPIKQEKPPIDSYGFADEPVTLRSWKAL